MLLSTAQAAPRSRFRSSTGWSPEFPYASKRESLCLRPATRSRSARHLREEIPEDANILPRRFVLAIKSTEDGEVKFKARYIIGCHREKFKVYIVHSSQTLQPASVRLLLALAAIHSFEVWTADVRQAYLQSAEPLLRDIFIKDPVPEFKLDAGHWLQLIKPPYGFCESGDL